MPCWVVLLHLLYLVEQVSDTLLSNSLFNCSIFGYLKFAIFAGSIEFSFISLHCKCFSTSCLAIRKNSGMVTLNHLVDEIGYAESLIDIALSVLLLEHLVKVVEFPSVKISSKCLVLLSTVIIWVILDNFNLSVF